MRAGEIRPSARTARSVSRISEQERRVANNQTTPPPVVKATAGCADAGCDMFFGVRRAAIFGILLAAIAWLVSGAGVTEQKLRTAQTDAATWLSYGKNYS